MEIEKYKNARNLLKEISYLEESCDVLKKIGSSGCNVYIPYDTQLIQEITNVINNRIDQLKQEFNKL